MPVGFTDGTWIDDRGIFKVTYNNERALLTCISMASGRKFFKKKKTAISNNVMSLQRKPRSDTIPLQGSL